MQHTEIFLAVKIENFHLKNVILLIFMLKNWLWVHICVLTRTHNLCFGWKKGVNPCIPQFYYIKLGFKGVYIPWIRFPDNCPQPPLYIFSSLTSLSKLFQLIWDESISKWGENGGAPRKKHLAHLQAELGLSHMCPMWGSNLFTNDWCIRQY